MPEEQLEEMRAAIREKLEKANKGGAANSISKGYSTCPALL